MRRFFLDHHTIAANTALLTGSEAHHLLAVLRLQPGAAIELFDGHGHIYAAQITAIERGTVRVRIESCTEQSPSAIPPLMVALGLLKGKKMDFLVQKATELGVHTFQPLVTRFSEKRDLRERQQERWQRIMLEACKQCNRAQPMQIMPLRELTHFTAPAAGLKLMFWEREQQRAVTSALTGAPQPLWLLIGPEGGFHPQEVELATSLGFQTVSLGPQTLRAETAALSAMVIAQFLLGGLDPGERRAGAEQNAGPAGG